MDVAQVAILRPLGTFELALRDIKDAAFDFSRDDEKRVAEPPVSEQTNDGASGRLPNLPVAFVQCLPLGYVLQGGPARWFRAGRSGQVKRPPSSHRCLASHSKAVRLLRCAAQGRGLISLPALCNERRLPFRAGREHFVMRSADLGADNLLLGPDQQSHLPAELVTGQRGARLTPVFVQNEQIANRVGRAVPIQPLEDLDGHGREI
jgi:hypothetical protein